MTNDHQQPERIALELLQELKHLDVNDLKGRTVPFHGLYDGQRWHVWFRGNGKLFLSHPVDMGEGCYFATDPARPDDIHFDFLECLHQQAYWPDLEGLVDGIYADVQNAGASLSKLELIFKHADRKSLDPSRMVVTELEYVFLTCRSIFDLLQELMLRLWKKVRFHDTNAKKENLPNSFRKMVVRDEIPMSAEMIAARFHLPPQIASVYANSAPFFMWLRSYRDLIAHHGHTPHYIYVTDKGFAVSKSESPFCDMDIWSESNSMPNGLGSVLSVVAHILVTTFATCDAFMIALRTAIEFPPRIAPNHHIFMRGPHLKNLVLLDRRITKSPWYDLAEAGDK